MKFWQGNKTLLTIETQKNHITRSTHIAFFNAHTGFTNFHSIIGFYKKRLSASLTKMFQMIRFWTFLFENNSGALFEKKFVLFNINILLYYMMRKSEIFMEVWMRAVNEIWAWILITCAYWRNSLYLTLTFMRYFEWQQQ